MEKEYKLPNGDTIVIGRERFLAPEILMNPSIIEKDEDDIASMVYKSIVSCPMDIQIPLANNIWLSGGTTMIPGLSTRLEQEIKEQYVKFKFKGDRSGLNRVKVQVHDPPRRKNAVFMGGSFLANFAKDEQYISKQEYEETGTKVFFKR